MYIGETEKAIIEIADCTIPDMERIAQISDLHEIVIDAAAEAARTVARIEEALRAAITSARRDLDAAEAALNARTAINERGILQGTATEIDILAARRHDAYARLTVACRTATALPAPSPTT